MQKIWQRSLPAILISADTSDELRHIAEKHHLNYLAKPVKPAALLNVLRVLISQTAEPVGE